MVSRCGAMCLVWWPRWRLPKAPEDSLPLSQPGGDVTVRGNSRQRRGVRCAAPLLGPRTWQRCRAMCLVSWPCPRSAKRQRTAALHPAAAPRPSAIHGPNVQVIRDDRR